MQNFFCPGITEGSGSGLDAMLPSSEEDFEEFRKALIKKIIPFSSSQHYPVFVEELIRDISANSKSLLELYPRAIY